jgi:hypothetical protein
MLWSLYTLGVLAPGFGRTVERIMRDSGGLPSRYGPMLGAVVVAVGVVGYLSSRPVGRAWVWKGVFALSAVGAAGLLGLEVILLQSYDAPWRIHAMTLAGAVLLAPAVNALYRYAFRSPAIWREPAHPAPSLADAEHSSGP